MYCTELLYIPLDKSAVCKADAASPGLLEAALMARAGSSVYYSLGVNIHIYVQTAVSIQA